MNNYQLITNIIQTILTLFLIFLILMLSDYSEGADKIYGDIKDVQYVSNFDGDTITVNIFNEHPIISRKISVRIFGIDTPEIRGRCNKEKELALKAKEFTGGILSKAKVIDLMRIRRDKYFRIVAVIMADGKNVANELLKNRLAYMYYGKTKSKDWCKQ